MVKYTLPMVKYTLPMVKYTLPMVKYTLSIVYFANALIGVAFRLRVALGVGGGLRDGVAKF